MYLDSVLNDWLESKALEGYKKTSLIRRALHIFREREITGGEPRRRCGLGMRGCIRYGGESYDPDESDDGEDKAE